MMEQIFLDFVKGFDLQNLIAMIIIIWGMSKPIRNNISNLENKIDALKEDVNTVKKDVQDIDRRLCRIEGSLSSKECFILKNDQTLRKAE